MTVGQPNNVEAGTLIPFITHNSTTCSSWSIHWGSISILIVTCSMETVNDGQFHTVELLTFNQKLNLSVDGGEPMTLDSQGRSQAATGEVPLYVGGEV